MAETTKHAKGIEQNPDAEGAVQATKLIPPPAGERMSFENRIAWLEYAIEQLSAGHDDCLSRLEARCTRLEDADPPPPEPAEDGAPDYTDGCDNCIGGMPGGCPVCKLDRDRVTAFIEAARRSPDGVVAIDLRTGAMSSRFPISPGVQLDFQLHQLEGRCETLEALWAAGTLERSRRVGEIERAIEGLQRVAGIPEKERLI